ncbi:tetratricopeptide repeat protein [Maribacter halichondriae]|uniref:tetratricopeptide repeat protein n=1 Tax=Maribacter halichondriae TaxID=2980554 RepID=UPI00235848B7|nr:tetratricopeptide repeat protein [Maribacter sp. Hal144]
MNFKDKTILSIVCLLFFTIGMQSQNTVIDSLKDELSLYTKKDTIRVNILNDLAYAYYQKDSLKTQTYLEESEALANKLNFTKGRAKSLYVKGVTQAAQSNFDKGFQYFNEALRLYNTINFKIGIVECYNAIGILFYDKGDQRLAIEYYEKSIRINEEIDDKKNIAINSNNIGKAYSNLGNYEEALKYHRKALKISKESGDEKTMSSSFNNMGTIYSDQGNYPLALEYYNQSLAIDEKFGDTLGISKSLNNLGIIYKNLQNYDKAIASYERALKIHKKNDDKKSTTETLNNLGNVHKRKENYKIALDFLEEALEISKEIKNKIYIGTILNNIGDVHLQLKDDAVAFEYFEKAKKINLEADNPRALCNSYLGVAKIYTNKEEYDKALTNALKSKELSGKLQLLNYQTEVFELLSDIYKNKGDYKRALTSHQQFKILNDSLFNKENIEKITQLEYEYKYKQALDSASIRELKLTKEVSSINTNLEKSQRNIFLTIIAFLLTAIILGGIIFFLKLRNIKEKNQNISIEQKLLRSQMTPHFIFNSLSVLQGMILNNEGNKSVLYLSKFSKLLRTSLENSRQVLVSLSEELSAIDNYIELQNLAVNPPVTYHLEINPTIDRTIFKIPPMLIQPFVENAIEHAFTSKKEDKEIRVQISFEDKKIICNITDNGIGINKRKLKTKKNKNSLATAITSERLKMLSKEFRVQSSVSVADRASFGEQGTLVTLVIPYKIDSIK